MNDSKEKSLHNYSPSQNRCADIKRWQVTQASRTIKRQWDGILVTVPITVRLGVEPVHLRSVKINEPRWAIRHGHGEYSNTIDRNLNECLAHE
jgi:hypothetical protein